MRLLGLVNRVAQIVLLNLRKNDILFMGVFDLYIMDVGLYGLISWADAQVNNFNRWLRL